MSNWLLNLHNVTRPSQGLPVGISVAIIVREVSRAKAVLICGMYFTQLSLGVEWEGPWSKRGSYAFSKRRL